MTIGKLCTREVVIVDGDENVMEAAKLMAQCHVGDVVAVEAGKEKGRPIGILTDRDIVLRVLAAGRDPATTPIREVMTKDPLLIPESRGIYEALEPMRARGVRRVPVVNAEGLMVGILSIDDVLDLLAQEIGDLAKLIDRERSREGRSLGP